MLATSRWHHTAFLTSYTWVCPARNSRWQRAIAGSDVLRQGLQATASDLCASCRQGGFGAHGVSRWLRGTFHRRTVRRSVFLPLRLPFTARCMATTKLLLVFGPWPSSQFLSSAQIGFQIQLGGSHWTAQIATHFSATCQRHCGTCKCGRADKVILRGDVAKVCVLSWPGNT